MNSGSILTKSEVVAYLVALERDLLSMSRRVSELKLMVIEGLDNDDEEVLD